MMTKTNGKYTYEDFKLRKRILKYEIHEMEKMISMETLPKTLGFIGRSIKGKTLEFVTNPNLLNFIIDVGIGVGSERLISRWINKKDRTGITKIALTTSAYLIPLTLNITKKLIEKTQWKKDKT